MMDATDEASTTDRIVATDLMAGMLADAVMLVRDGRASAADVDTAMQLGAGYPQGPLAVLATLPSGILPLPAPDVGSGDVQSAAHPWTGPIGLVGTGTMAAGIAEAIARSGRQILVLSRSAASHAAMIKRIKKSLARSVEKGRFTSIESDAALASIAMVTQAGDLAGCDLVIEAVKESLDVKRETFATLDHALPKDIPFATNTSSFRVADIGESGSGRIVFAMHFFNPAQAMKLVELVYTGDTAPEFRARAAAFARAIGKVPVDCADRRGFVVNRLLIPFLNDMVRAHEAGASIEAIDAAMVEQLEHPMGPFALIDMIGLDVMVLALESMAETEGDPRIAPAATFHQLIAQGHLGRKTGRGFHTYGATK